MYSLSPLKSLAERLAYNNVNISLWKLIQENIGKNQPHSVYENILHENHPAQKEPWPMPERTIVIVGAGASCNACGEFLTGHDTANKLREKFEKRLGKRVLDDELRRLAQVYRLPAGEFETILFGISKFFTKGLKKELSKRFQFRHQPSLTYEILAHLFKHRFIDVIINFNFDELLDQAIADEMNPGEYQRIISDGDYDKSLLFDEDGLRYPVYIKPHGTVSHVSSMRFTREDYFGLPADIEEAIRTLIHPIVPVKSLGLSHEHFDGAKVEMPVNIIIVGFDLQSFEFNNLLNQNLPDRTRFFFFQRNVGDKYFDKKDGGKKEFPDRLEKMIRDDTITKWIHVSSDKPHSLDSLFLMLWEEHIMQNYRPTYAPRNIDRHKLICRLFQSDQKRKDDALFEYLQDRALIEFALSIAKYKGFLCIEPLASDRFGKYFNLLKYHNRNRDIKYKTIPDYCTEFGLFDYGYGKVAFSLSPINEDTVQQLTVSSADFFGKYYKQIEDVLKRTLSETTRTRLLEKNSGFKETLKMLFTHQDTEISPVYHNIYQNVFLDPKIINTQLAFDYYTRNQFFKTGDYDAVYIIAETGEWLQKLVNLGEYRDELRKKKYCLIIADRVRNIVKTDIADQEDNVVINSLPWWRHNQHITIFAKIDSGQDSWGKPVKAIYFTRKQRSTHINPVILEKKDDLAIIWNTFGAYFSKSLKSEPKADENNIEDILKNYIAGWPKLS